MQKLCGRIQFARKNAGLTQKDLAERVGISQTAIHKLECGRSVSSRRMIAIALACGVDPVWLETGFHRRSTEENGIAESSCLAHPSSVGSGSTTMAWQERVPLISWATIPLWSKRRLSGIRTQPIPIESWLPTLSSYNNKNIYAVQIQDESMADEFIPDDILFIHLTAPLKHRSFIIVQFPDEELPCPRQLLVDGCKLFLATLKPEHPIVPLHDDLPRFGTVICKNRNY